MGKQLDYYIQDDPKVIELLEKIAREECAVDTLKTQYSDGLDFHDISSASLLAALHAAYILGKNFNNK